MIDETTLKQWCAQALSERPFGDKRFPPSVYYRFLRIAAQSMQPELSVELGVSGGGGSLHLAMGWPRGQVVGVDMAWDHQENINFILDNYPNYKFILGDSTESAKDIYEQFGPIDILFIDTTHTYEQTIKELNTYRPYLTPNSLVCLDDLLRPEMEGIWEVLPGDKLRLDHLHSGAENGGGFGLLWNL